MSLSRLPVGLPFGSNIKIEAEMLSSEWQMKGPEIVFPIFVWNFYLIFFFFCVIFFLCFFDFVVFVCWEKRAEWRERRAAGSAATFVEILLIKISNYFRRASETETETATDHEDEHKLKRQAGRQTGTCRSTSTVSECNGAQDGGNDGKWRTGSARKMRNGEIAKCEFAKRWKYSKRIFNLKVFAPRHIYLFYFTIFVLRSSLSVG